MRLLPRLSSMLLLAFAACGPEPAPVAPVNTAQPVVAAPPETAAPAPLPPLPPLDPSLPAGSAGLASIDVAQADAILGAALRDMPAEGRARMEQELHLAGGALADGHVARAFGLDPARPIVASVGLVGGGTAARERLLELVGKHATAAALRQVLDGFPELGVALRVVLPTTDGAIAMGVIAALFEADRWVVAPPPDGIDEMYVERRHRAFAGVSRTQGAVVVDIVLPSAPPPGQDEKAAHDRGLAVLRGLRSRAPGGPHDAPPPLDGHPARARYAPAAFADIGLVTGVSTTLRAVTSPGIDDAQRDALAAQGLAESATSQRLAGRDGHPYFERLDFTLDGGYGSLGFTVRADPGPAADLPAAAWARTPGIAIHGAFALMDIGLPWMRSWASLSVAPRRRDLKHLVREAGLAGAFVALPQMFAAEIWEPMERFEERPALMKHLDRITIFTPDRNGSDSWVALLAPGTKPADVACALVAQGDPCAPASMLRVGATVKSGNHHARLVQVKGRLAIVMSRDKATVEKTKVELGAAPSAPARVELPGRAELARELRPLPPAILAEGYVGDARLEGRQAIVEVRPAPPRAAAPKGAPAPAKRP